MREELGKNEDVVDMIQSRKIKQYGKPLNLPRRHVGAFWLIFWLGLALCALSLWLLRLLNLIQAP